MTLVKIFTAALMTLSATTALASKCTHKDMGGRFANTNPPKSVQVAKAQVTKSTATR